MQFSITACKYFRFQISHETSVYKSTVGICDANVCNYVCDAIYIYIKVRKMRCKQKEFYTMFHVPTRNLAYNTEGRIVYYTAAVGIIRFLIVCTRPEWTDNIIAIETIAVDRIV